MVKLSTIQQSDAQLGEFFAKLPSPVVALFVGATNGIGRNTVRHFAKVTRRTSSRVYFVGRSHERGEQLKSELANVNPSGYYEFIPADVSLMAVVDEVCQKFRDKEEYLNLLYMSQGTTQPEFDTIEKLPFRHAVIYYSKVRFALNLAPLMQNAPGLRRTVIVFGSSLEGTVVTDDLDGRNLSTLRGRDLVASKTTLAVDKLSQEFPEVSWVHNFPGFVESGIWDGMEGVFGVVWRLFTSFIGFFFHMKPEECGQRQMFAATSARFPPAKQKADGMENGVPLSDGTLPVVGINGKEGGGSYTVNEHAEPVSSKIRRLLAGYVADGTQDVAWEHTLKTFQRVTGKERLSK